MRLLLDTHTFLWFIDGSQNLSEYARRLIEAPSNERLLSIASLWEMSIKISLGFWFKDLFAILVKTGISALKKDRYRNRFVLEILEGFQLCI